MAGHSHWKQIKHQKGATDKKRSALFAKLLKAIAVAAKEEQNPEFNPRLRTTIEKASAANVPRDTIQRAIERSQGNAEILEDVVMEAYGPGGTAILMKGITDNRNRTIAEIKTLLKNHNAKWAEPGSVTWVFENEGEPKAKFPLEISKEDSKELNTLVDTLEEHDDIQSVYTNAKL